jgi:TonB family protein
MRETVALSNLVAYTGQIFCIVALGSLLAWLLRMHVAVVRYAYWRVILAVCLLLPVLQGRQLPQSHGQGSILTEIGQVRPSAAALPAAEISALDWTSVVLLLLAAGVVARLAWIVISLVRLRRLRPLGRPAEESAVHVELQELIGVRCEIRYVDALRQPVTFGFWRPVILLPTGLAERNPDIHRAVLSHELFHVKRRDWGWLLFEEIVCAVFWFNPAVWWMVSRVQLAREVVVDELAVLATGRRRAYVEALIAFADETSLAPVAAFARRRQLFNRIVLLSKEAVMSSHRLVVTCGIMLAALAVGSWQAVRALPLEATPPQVAVQTAPGPLEQRANPITPENPIPRRVNYQPPEYPAEARIAGARGSVTLMLTLDELGRVAEARRINLKVQSANPPVTVVFSGSNPEDEKRFMVNGSREQSDTVRAIGAAMTEASIRSVQQWRYEPPANGPITFPVTLTFFEGQEGAAIQGEVSAAAQGTKTVWVEGALRVGGNIKTPKKIRDVRPVYPPLAQAASVSGMVIIEARIGPDGVVEDTRVLRSIPLLDQAAIDAVMQWQFTPTLLNGRAVPVVMTVTVNFTLQQADLPREVTPDPPFVEAVQVVPRRARGRAQTTVAEGVNVSPQRRLVPELVKEVKPSYTSLAMRARIQGSVEMEVTIGVDGKVTGARVIKSLPMLDEAALTAVRQWEFKPLPQPVATTIEMSFRLDDSR